MKSIDKLSSVSSSKMPSHVNKTNYSPKLDLTKTSPLHTGKSSSKPKGGKQVK